MGGGREGREERGEREERREDEGVGIDEGREGEREGEGREGEGGEGRERLGVTSGERKNDDGVEWRLTNRGRERLREIVLQIMEREMRCGVWIVGEGEIPRRWIGGRVLETRERRGGGGDDEREGMRGEWSGREKGGERGGLGERARSRGKEERERGRDERADEREREEEGWSSREERGDEVTNVRGDRLRETGEREGMRGELEDGTIIMRDEINVEMSERVRGRDGEGSDEVDEGQEGGGGWRDYVCSGRGEGSMRCGGGGVRWRGRRKREGRRGGTYELRERRGNERGEEGRLKDRRRGNVRRGKRERIFERERMRN
ncbi:hypothetical protein Tco_0103532 [Tanacetum coccineum]